jgi:protein TonB
MLYALNKRQTKQRHGLLGLVIGAHLLAGIVLLSAKAVAPHIAEIPLVVDLLQEAATPSQSKPQPVTKPPIVQPQLTPQAAKPPLKASTSPIPAEQAPIASPPENKQAAPATTAENISQARFDTEYLRNPAPPYPPLARRNGETGKVVLRVAVNTQGIADTVEIMTSSGSHRLDEAAQKTVRNWRFIPAKRGETAIQSWVLVPIIFKLEQ